MYLSDFIKETAPAPGIGSYALAGAVAGFAAIPAAANGLTLPYGATDGAGYESGIGTYTHATRTLARTTIKKSSNSDNAVNWVGSAVSIVVGLLADMVPATYGTTGQVLRGVTGAASAWGDPLAIGDAITSATAGSILFAGAGGVLAQDNAQLFWDDTNNRLGVGLSNPQHTVQFGGILGSWTDFSVIGNNQSGTMRTPSITVIGNKGTYLAPALVTTDTRLGGFYFAGQYDGVPGHYRFGAALEAYAAENYSTSTFGSYFVFGTTPIGTNTRLTRMFIHEHGGVSMTPGTAVAAGVAALSIARTNNNALVDTGVKWTFTDSLSAAGFLPFIILGGAAGATSLFSLSKIGEAVAPYFTATTNITGTTEIQLASGVARFNSTGFRAAASKLFGWSSDADSANVFDVAFSRISAGVVGVGTGAAGSFAGSLKLNNTQNVGYQELDEMTAPAGVANAARVFTQDNGAGKTQLMVIFGSGVAQQIAIEA